MFCCQIGRDLNCLPSCSQPPLSPAKIRNYNVSKLRLAQGMKILISFILHIASFSIQMLPLILLGKSHKILVSWKGNRIQNFNGIDVERGGAALQPNESGSLPRIRPATRIGYSALFHITRPHEIVLRNSSACHSKITGTWNFHTKIANRLYLRSQPSTGLPELGKDLKATLEISAFPDLRFCTHAPKACHLGSWFPRLPFSILSRLRHSRAPLEPHIGSPFFTE